MDENLKCIIITIWKVWSWKPWLATFSLDEFSILDGVDDEVLDLAGSKLNQGNILFGRLLM